jgi:hypothetical protein
VNVFIGECVVCQRPGERVIVEPDLVLRVDPLHTNSVWMLLNVFLEETETVVTQTFVSDVITNFWKCHCQLLTGR